MGILYMNTADVGDTTLFQAVGISLIVSDVQQRTGSKSFASSSSTLNSWAVIAIPSSQSGYGRVCVYTTGRTAPYPNFQVRLREGTTVHLMAFLDQSSGVVNLYRGTTSTLIASESANVPGENVWVAWEFYWNIHDTTGVFTLKANGTQVMHFTGDTRNAGLGTVNNLYLGNDSLSVLGNWYMDDIIVRDDQWPMRGGIHVLTPNADGDTVSWTKSDALKGYHEHINTQPPDYTDYLETDVTVAATKQLTHLTTLADDVWNIRGVGAHVNCKSTVSTDAFVRTLLLPADVAADVEVGSDFGVESAASWARTYYEQNPHDSAAWEKADIDDLQIGVETRVPA